MTAVVTLDDILAGHVGLDIECLDRIYVNGYVPNLHVGGQVSSFMTAHLGLPIPSPAVMERIGTRFRRGVRAFAEEHPQRHASPRQSIGGQLLFSSSASIMRMPLGPRT
jgi:hypothetical protein